MPRLRQALSVAPQCLRFASALRGNGAEITSLVVLVPSLTLRHCVQQEICENSENFSSLRSEIFRTSQISAPLWATLKNNNKQKFMQKIDFVKNLETIVEKLKSREIVTQFQSGFAQPGQNFNYATINPLLFLSKSNYDQIKNEPQYSDILTSLDAQSIYIENNLSNLTTILRTVQAHQILTQTNAVSLYNFHNTLIQTSNLSKNILQSKSITESLINEVDNGVVIFQILIEGEGLATSQYIKIFTALNELIDTLSKIVNEQEQKSEIILLDSGSDSNVGIKSGIETAKSLFLYSIKSGLRLGNMKIPRN